MEMAFLAKKTTMFLRWQKAPLSSKAALAVLLVTFMTLAPAWAQETPYDVSPGYLREAWDDIRDMLWEDKVIGDGKGVITLIAPYRAQDAAIVPITIAAAKPQTEEEFIESITLVIDQNPLPVGTVFHLTPDSGLATIDTRIRINAFTYVRAIAKMNDGRLFMATKFVRATGGCGAPPGVSGMEEALASAGKMKMKFLASDLQGLGGQAQLMIKHPNFSGFQQDQVDPSLFIPAYYVDSIEVTRGGTKILSIESDISMSEDPSIRFYYGDETSGDVTAVVTDTHGKTFKKSWSVVKLAEN